MLLLIAPAYCKQDGFVDRTYLLANQNLWGFVFIRAVFGMWAAEQCKQESHNCLLLSNGVSQHGADAERGGKARKL